MVKEETTLSTTIHRLFYEKNGQIVVSALFGLALALIFRRVCKDNCTVYFAPNIKDIENKSFIVEDVCYKYKPYTVKCDNTKENYKSYDINVKPDNELTDYGVFTRMFS